MNDESQYKIEITDDTTAGEGPAGVPVRQQLLLVTGILVLIFGTALTPRFIAGIKAGLSTDAPEPTYTEPAIDAEHEPTIKPFEEVQVVAKAAYVFDVANQRALYKKNESEVLPLASVTKLMTALVAYEVLADTDAVVIDNTAIMQDGDSGLLEGEVFNRMSLTDLVLMSSSNDGAYALAVKAGDVIDPDKSVTAFVQAMNVRAREIGLNETEFKNPTGLDQSITESGANGSARDMTFLMEYIVKNTPEILTYTQEDTARLYSETGQFHDTENTNYFIDKIPNLIGSKTGYTDLAGGNLVIAYNAGLTRPVIISVLGSTHLNRFTDVLKLIEETNNYLANE